MKYLSIYEKFDSQLISNTINFLSKKINKSSSDRFINILKKDLDYLDFPISRLEDNDIQYLNKNKALRLKSEDPSDLDYLKFWFSLEEGYLFTSGTGKSKLVLKTDEEYKNIITDENQIKNLQKTVPTGIVTPVMKYRDLKHLDKVVGIFSDGAYNKFSKGTIYIESDYIFVIQDSSIGGEPNGSESEWKKYGTYSWNIGRINRDTGNDDHHYLHYYEDSNEALKIINPKSNIDEYNPYLFNLKYSYGKLDQYYNMESDVKQADFALVISIKNLLSKNYSIRDTRKKRGEEKIGAASLLDNETIKKVNIDRYTKKLFNKLGILEDGLDLQNLEKILIKILLGEMSFYKMISNYDKISKISSITQEIKYIIKSSNKNDITNSINRIYEIYSNINREYNLYYKLFKDNIEEVKKYAIDNENTYLTEIMDIFDRMSLRIFKSVSEDKINNIHDLYSYYFKLSTVINMFDNYIDDYDFKYIFKYIYNNSDVRNQLRYIDKENCMRHLEPIKAIERYINKNFM